MEKLYDDEMLPEDFEQIAKAYSSALKDKDFVFVRLESEEFGLLVDEVFVLLAKMKACLKRLEKRLDSADFVDNLCTFESKLQEKFDKKKPHNFTCVENENVAFLTLVSVENMLLLKLMSLSAKSGEASLCNEIVVCIISTFAECFDIQGFVIN
jgi:hypothetical protein